MHSKLLKSAPWPLLIGGKLLQVYPVGTILAVLLALPSQLALIVAFLLPIKIVMLMASEGMPRFMPAIASSVEKSSLIIILSALSVIAFLFNQIANKAIDKIATSGTKRLEKRNQKLHLFDGQENLTKSSYTRYVDTIASLTFILLGFLALFLLYPEISTVLFIYIFLCIVIPACKAIIQKTDTDTETITNQIQAALPMLSTAGFFLIFFSVVIDYVAFDIPESFIKILISVILGRQILNRTSIVAKNFFFFHQQKNKLRALLFHGVALKTPTPRNSSAMTFLNKHSAESLQLKNVISSLANKPLSHGVLTWVDPGIKGITILTAELREERQTLLVKIFDHNKAAAARQEAILLNEARAELPSPKLVKAAVIAGFHVHIFDITGYKFLNNTSLSVAKTSVMNTLSKIPVPAKLLSRYKRSHAMLWEQLSGMDLHQIELAIPESHIAIQSFKAVLPPIQETLKALPLRLNNHSLNNLELYLQKPNGDFAFIHWGKWSIEPMGAGISNPTALDLDNPTLEKASVSHLPDSVSISIASLSKRLFREIDQHAFGSAKDTLSRLTSLIEQRV